MAKEFFKDLPNTTTPLTSSRLNGLLDGEEAMGNIVVDSIKGKNLFDKNTIVAGSITGGSTSTRLCSRQALWLEVGTYTFSTNLSSTYNWGVQVQSVGVPPLSSEPTFIEDSPWQSGTSYTFTINTAGYFNLLLRKSDNGNLYVSDIINFNYQLESGSSATNNAPYQGLETLLGTINSITGNLSNNSNICVRYTNGLMIYYNRVQISADFSAPLGSLYRQTVDNPFTFPVPFKYNPNVYISTANDGDYAFSMVYGIYRSTTGISRVDLVRPSSSSSGYVYLHCLAIGFWK